MPPKPSIRVPNKFVPAARRQPAKTSPRKSSTPSPTPPQPAATRPTPSTLRTAARCGFYATMSLCLGLSIRDYYFDFDKVSGASMAPTINPSVHETGRRDVIFVRPYMHSRPADADATWWGGPGSIKRGDVVTFWKPHRPEERGLKRVIAIEGDEVWVKSGYALADSNVSRLGGMPDGLTDWDPDAVSSALGEERGKVVVPYGHVWVEGDNWRSSLDSRDIGPISKSLVMGKVVGVWRGWGEWRGTEDERRGKEREGASRVVEGRCELPEVYLE